MDDLCVQNSHPLVGCLFEDRINNDLVWHTVLMSGPSTVLLRSSQRSQEILQPYHDSFRLKLQ